MQPQTLKVKQPNWAANPVPGLLAAAHSMQVSLYPQILCKSFFGGSPPIALVFLRGVTFCTYARGDHALAHIAGLRVTCSLSKCKGVVCCTGDSTP